VLDDARPNTAAAMANHIATFGWKHLDHAPYSPDLAPSDFHSFPTLKSTLKGRLFTTNEDDEAAIWTQDTAFYQQVFFKLVKLWDKCINVGGDYVEKQLTNAPFRTHQCVSCPSCFLQMATKETYFPTILLNSSVILMKLSGPRSRPTTSKRIWQRQESNLGPLDL
jgi:histone-lysine N-methyltransferase SETMAR